MPNPCPSAAPIPSKIPLSGRLSSTLGISLPTAFFPPFITPAITPLFINVAPFCPFSAPLCPFSNPFPSFSQLVTTAILLTPPTIVLSSIFVPLLFNTEIAIPKSVTVMPTNPIGDSFSPSIIQPKKAAKGGASVMSSWPNLAVIMVYE
ncbi:MAG: hypothetical protein ACD_77C00229G0001 [uncultured bacterium]|nr:MAG: hypothetical protein ACD_77C00229G0001 [uncultured bacterium]